MVRRVIEIDREKCNGCGACATACHEGAIGIVNGKAKLLRDDYCDGFGDCLPACPMDAIHFVEREAAAYDEAAVQANKRKKQVQAAHAAHAGGCPGHQMHRFQREEPAAAATPAAQPSQLGQWPCQIKLVPVNAPYFQGAKLLIAADCTAYAYANMHSEFMKGKITLIGCPKLDAVDYTDKLTEIIRGNDIQSVTIVRMEVPCCGGLEYAARQAVAASADVLIKRKPGFLGTDIPQGYIHGAGQEHGKECLMTVDGPQFLEDGLTVMGVTSQNNRADALL